MVQVQEGQCGLCKHFGENDEQAKPQLIQIRTSKSAPEDVVEPCGHPKLESLSLAVTATSSCAGFEAAA